ncbi:MAG: 50S ribosomal protein L11 methyltransferase, partial [Blastocatellia bacterium]|nr:50S ribosomal protein L11 methyltransferase [Blastocatellia bacterium]
VAKENTEINSVNKIVNLSVASASNYQSGNYDLIVANLTAEVIVEILDDLVACLAKDGKIVLSGILDVQEQQVVEALNARSLVLGQIEKAGEWISIIASLS